VFVDALRSNDRECAAAHCNTLQHTATHCNTLQHTASHCVTLQRAHTTHLQESARRCTAQQRHAQSLYSDANARDHDVATATSRLRSSLRTIKPEIERGPDGAMDLLTTVEEIERDLECFLVQAKIKASVTATGLHR